MQFLVERNEGLVAPVDLDGAHPDLLFERHIDVFERFVLLADELVKVLNFSLHLQLL